MICKRCCNELTMLSDDGAVEFCFFCLDAEMAEVTNTIAGKFRARAMAAQEDDSLAGEVEELTILREIEAAALHPRPMDGYYTFADGGESSRVCHLEFVSIVWVGCQQPLHLGVQNFHHLFTLTLHIISPVPGPADRAFPNTHHRTCSTYFQPPTNSGMNR